MTGRRHCRADELIVGMSVSVGYAFGPIAELRKTRLRVELRIEGDDLWHNWRPDEAVFLEPAEQLAALLAARTR